MLPLNFPCATDSGELSRFDNILLALNVSGLYHFPVAVPSLDLAQKDLLAARLAFCRYMGFSTVYPIVNGCSQEAVFEGTVDGCNAYVAEHRDDNPDVSFVILPS